MSDKRYEANIIRATAVEPANNLQATSAPGVWSIDEVVELQKKSKWPTVGNVITNVENVFSTFVYEGTNTARNIENGIALGNSNDGGSVEFDGTGDYLNLSTPVVPASGQFSLEAFIYPTATTDEAIASQHSNATTGRFIFRLDNGKLNFNWAASELTDANSITANAWSHCLVTRDASNVIRLFVNGALRKSTTNSVTFDQTNFTIGASRIASPEKFFNGFISNVRVVSGAIPTEYQTSSTTEGAAIYTTPTSGLTAVSNTALLTCQGSTPLVDNSSNSYAITTNADAAARAFGPFTGTGGKGGLVWFKSRESSGGHTWYDTARGVEKAIYSNSTNAEGSTGSGVGLTAFNSNGFSLGTNWVGENSNDDDVVSWTFRKQAKFFDVVTYTGNGSNRTIAHNLGTTVGMMLVKLTSGTDGWAVYHRAVDNSAPEDYRLRLDTNAARVDNTDGSRWNRTAPTSSVFSLGTDGSVNANGSTYVAYLFAHNNNDGGFGPDQDGDIIKCGSYTGNNSTTGVFQDLGFEPAWIMCKNAGLTEPWVMLDNMRGVTGAGGNDPRLVANDTNAELGGEIMDFNPTGFTPLTADDKINGGSYTYIYMAIRRGPMATPTAATNVFSLVSQAGGYQVNRKATTGFPVDFAFNVQLSPGADKYLYDRKRGERKDLKTSQDHVEGSNSPGPVSFDFMDGVKHQLFNSANTVILSMWRRAPGYFDIVKYTGTGSARTLAHNLGVAPEMIWVKDRGRTQNWAVYHASNTSEPATERLRLNEDGATVDDSAYWNDTQPTSSVFTVGTDGDVNTSGESYIAYLFATLPGISKLGSFVSDGNPQNIECGFSSGARYILIKKSSGTFNWRVWDTTRGIVAGDDPYYFLDTNDANTTNGDWVDPYSSGFSITTAFSNGTYIFYAIA